MACEFAFAVVRSKDAQKQLARTSLNPVSWIFSVTWLARDVKEPTHLSKRVGHVVPGVVVWPCLMGLCFT